MKRIIRPLSLLLALVLAFGLLPPMPAAAAENPFVDVSEEDEFFGPVMWAYYHQPVQITNGTDETHFTPDKTVTRGQAVRFLWNAAGQPAPKDTKNPFVDNKSGKFYYSAVLWAYYNDPQITNAGADDFQPLLRRQDREVLREGRDLGLRKGDRDRRRLQILSRHRMYPRRDRNVHLPGPVQASGDHGRAVDHLGPEIEAHGERRRFSADLPLADAEIRDRRLVDL